MELIGTIKKIDKTIQVTETFKKREFILETDEMYPQIFKIECTKDQQINMLDVLSVGDTVKASINLRGRAYPSKKTPGEMNYFINISAWRLELEQTAGANVPPIPQSNAPASIDKNTNDTNDDGLPF